MISTSCPGCGRGIQTPESAAGKRVQCPACENWLFMPDAQTVLPEPAAAVPPASVTPPAQSVPSSNREPVKGQFSKRTKAEIAVLGLFGVLLLVLLRQQGEQASRLRNLESAVMKRAQITDTRFSGLQRADLTTEAMATEDGFRDSYIASPERRPAYSPDVQARPGYGGASTGYVPRTDTRQSPGFGTPPNNTTKATTPTFSRPEPASFGSQSKCISCQGTGQCQACKNHNRAVDVFGKPIKCSASCVYGRCKFCGGTGKKR